MSDEDKKDGTRDATPAAAATKKKPLRKKKKTAKRGAKKVASRPAPSVPAEPAASQAVSEPRASGESAPEPPASAAFTSAAESTHGISGALALWGPLIIIGFLVAVLKLGDGSEPPPSLDAAIEPLSLALPLPSADVIVELDEVIAATLPSVVSDSGGEGRALSETPSAAADAQALALTLPSSGSAASDLAAAFEEAGISLIPSPSQATGASSDTVAVPGTGSQLSAATFGTASALAQPAWAASGATTGVPAYPVATESATASFANPWALPQAGMPSPWDPNAELAPTGPDWPPPPAGAAAISPGAAVIPPAQPAGWPPQPVYVPCAPPYYWCLAPPVHGGY